MRAPDPAPATSGSAPDPAARSEESFLINLAALAAGIASVAWLAADNRWERLAEAVEYPAIVPCAVVFAGVAAGQMLRRWRRRRELTELAPRALRPLEWRRPMLRLLALAATLGIFGAAYAIFPEYRGNFYAPFWKFLRTIAYAVPLIPVYLVWSDTRLRDPRDELLELGLLLTGRAREVDYALIRRHFMGWAVKGFFTPLMTVYLSQEVQYLCTAFRGATEESWQNYDLWFHLSYGIDLLFCVVGYTATLRLFDSHIRSVEPTALGWIAALICYQPFYSIVGSMYLKYESDYHWDRWLGDWPHVQDAWGVAIILCVFTYALSTVAFGLRFSNLTHRGIITTGPYRFSKHPAYLAKNLSWWLIAVPFIPSPSVALALRHCALLLLLNGVYLLRARTEERHLSRDPRYVAYALWMNEHGALKGLGRFLPVLKYRAPPD